jgi:hypothetical protein
MERVLAGQALPGRAEVGAWLARTSWRQTWSEMAGLIERPCAPRGALPGAGLRRPELPLTEPFSHWSATVERTLAVEHDAIWYPRTTGM